MCEKDHADKINFSLFANQFSPQNVYTLANTAPPQISSYCYSRFLGIICAHSGVPVTPGGRHLGAFAATNMQTPVGWISESSRINGITKSSLLRKSEESAWHRPGEVMLG